MEPTQPHRYERADNGIGNCGVCGADLEANGNHLDAAGHLIHPVEVVPLTDRGRAPTYVSEELGNLGFMLTWQSGDGRPSVAYYGTFAEAQDHAVYLRLLGREPAVWHRIVGGEDPA